MQVMMQSMSQERHFLSIAAVPLNDAFYLLSIGSIRKAGYVLLQLPF